MNNPKLYTVKEAAKIVGVSTNTLYKYLDEGRINAARGSAIQGRFRIPETALEEFLGIKLSQSEPIESVGATLAFARESTQDDRQVQDLPLPIANKQTRLPLKLTRLLLFIGLLAMFIDVVISPTVTTTSLMTRLAFALALIILAYQQGGFRQKRV